jgi:hypothetical protein
MINLANAIGRVMMTAVSLPRSTPKENINELRKWAETEYRNDKHYALQCLLAGKRVDIR